MKLIIAGGRDYESRMKDSNALDFIHHSAIITEVVSGGCRGADTFGEAWACNNGIPIKQFLADWGRYGKSAGPLRNEEMAKYAHAVVLLPGGKGTEHMRKMAKKHKLIIYDLRYGGSNGTVRS